MNNALTLNLFFLVSILLFSCSGDDNSEGDSTLNLKVVTHQADILEAGQIILGGNIVQDGGSSIQVRGVCWSINNMPIRETGNYKEDYLNQLGNFDFSVENQLLPNTFYYARAYAGNENGDFEYGDVITFTTASVNFLQTLAPTEIMTTKAVLRGHISQNPTESSEVKFVYSTSPNPTINDQSVSNYVVGTDEFENTIYELQHNTTYYVRTVILRNGVYVYGQQKEFKTTGYTGEAGGYVAYDMGEENNGWRYLEIYPVTLSYDPNYTSGGAWGTYEFFIPGTTDSFGSGPQNTEIIASNDPSSNCAAKLCKNAVINGYSDWFLPSSQELLTIAKSLYAVNLLNINYTWTSTQNNSNFAYTVEFYNNDDDHQLFGNYPKSFENVKILPVRRY